MENLRISNRFSSPERLANPPKVAIFKRNKKKKAVFSGIAAIDLFCGAGGMTHGLIKAGVPVSAGIDIDPTCRYAYETNNKVSFFEKDIRLSSAKELKALYPKKTVKILVGCAPCQPFSTHTHKVKNRKKDDKWGLLYSFSDLIKEVKPKIVSMENVAQIMKHEVFNDFVKTLKRLGYQVFWRAIYCPDYGIPQSRRRLVLLASKLGKIELIPPTHSRDKYKTVRNVIEKLERITDGQASKKDPLHRSPNLSPLNKKRIIQSKPGGTWLDWDKKLRAPCHAKKSGETYSAVYARMDWDKVGPTITTQSCYFGTGRFGHPSQNRAISLRESAMLQTFPKRYKFLDPSVPFSFKKIGIHIGNAVPVRLGQIVGKSIKKHLEKYYAQ